jgi:hypothetical protein
MRSRARFGMAGLILAVLIAAFGLGAGSASGAEITTGKKCSPGKAICLTVRTFEGITASESTPDGTRYTYVDWTVQNDGGNTLTQVAVKVTLSESTAIFATPLPGGCTGGGTTITCKYPNLQAGTGPASSATTRAFFKTADAPAAGNFITAIATAKEGLNDKNTCPADGADPNCDTVSWTLFNSYEPDPDAALTFGLNGSRFRLPTNDGLSSFTFTAPAGSPFLTTFTKLATTDATALCFSTVECFDRPLSVSSGGVLSSGLSTPVLFYSRLATTLPPDKVAAIHYYDAVPLTLLPGNRLTSTVSFARMDGLRLTASTLGLAPKKYFVIGYQSSDNSFQLSETKGGVFLPLSATLNPKGEPVRIIGDKDDAIGDERSDAVCSTDIPPVSVTMPKICVKRAGQQTLDAYLWDNGNGTVNW